MRIRAKLTITGLAATALLAMTVAGASANNLRISEGTFRITYTPLDFAWGGLTASCNVTLEGSFHNATIAKIERALIGSITKASFVSCQGMTVTVLTETLPWHVQYGGFEGELPEISSVSFRLVGVAFNMHPEGTVECLARSTEVDPVLGTAELEEDRILGLQAGGSIPVEEFLCTFGGSGTFAGEGHVTGLGNTTPLTISLI